MCHLDHGSEIVVWRYKVDPVVGEGSKVKEGEVMGLNSPNDISNKTNIC